MCFCVSLCHHDSAATQGEVAMHSMVMFCVASVLVLPPDLVPVSVLALVLPLVLPLVLSLPLVVLLLALVLLVLVLALVLVSLSTQLLLSRVGLVELLRLVRRTSLRSLASK
jgi:hypothetical protein